MSVGHAEAPGVAAFASVGGLAGDHRPISRSSRVCSRCLPRDRAEDLAAKACRPLLEQMDSLAAEFLASPGWQQGSGADLRKKAAGQFPIPRADGFFPSAAVRDELYTKAKELSKAKGSGADGSGLF